MATARLLESDAGVGDVAFGVIEVGLVSAKLRLRQCERVAAVGWEGLVEEAVQVDAVGVGARAEALDAEGERIVGAHGAQGNVGPLVREGVVDLGGARDAPLRVVLSHATRYGDGVLDASRRRRESSCHAWSRVRRDRWCAGERVGRRG